MECDGQIKKRHGMALQFVFGTEKPAGEEGYILIRF